MTTALARTAEVTLSAAAMHDVPQGSLVELARWGMIRGPERLQTTKPGCPRSNSR